jgi:hypothetical protein
MYIRFGDVIQPYLIFGDRLHNFFAAALFELNRRLSK